MVVVLLFGTVGALGTTFSFLPQVVKMYSSERVQGVSPVMMATHLLGVSSWIVYGLLRRDYIVVAANSVSTMLVISMGALYVSKHKKSQEENGVREPGSV